MGRPVSANEARTIEREADRQFLNRHVVHDLVVGALQEGGVDGNERLEAFRGQPRRERHGVLLGDADIERPVGKGLAEEIEPRA